MIIVITIAMIGLIISLYGISIERKLQKDATYKPACDISDKISCSRPFLSPYRNIFGISNVWASALYYVAIICITIMNLPRLALITACGGVMVSVVFVYILYFKIKSFCLLCTSLYVVNIALCVACYFL